MTGSQEDKKRAFKKFFSWRHGFMDTDLPSTTKLVLHTIASHMNALGTGAFPSVETIMSESSLSRQAVIEHIKKAVDSHWLTKAVNKGEGRAWKHSEYSVCWPSDAVNDVDCQILAVNVASDGSQRGIPEAVYDVDSSTSVNSPLTLERDATKTTNKEQTQKLHLEQDVLPWMEKVWRNHPNCRRRKWEDPKFPSSFERNEEFEGAEVFRSAYLQYLETATKPNIIDFLYSRPKPPSKEVRRRHRPTPLEITGLSDVERLQKLIDEQKL